MSLTLSIDCMGGDLGPQMVFDSVKIFLEENKDLSVSLYTTILPEENFFRNFEGRVELVKCSDFVDPKKNILDSLKYYKKSTMGLALKSVKDGASQGVITLGSTGPYMILSRKILGFFEGFSKTPLAVFIPGYKKSKVLTDIGANLTCSAKDLHSFGVLGSILAKCYLGVDKPKVSLINVGHENIKGTPEVREAGDMMEKDGNFDGFIDSDKIFSCDADVIVTDGFSGNCISKSCEGTFRFLRSKLEKNFITRMLVKVLNRWSEDKYNGAIMMGIKGLSIKAHGSSSEKSFLQSLRTASKFIRSYEKLKQETNDASLIEQKIST
ncbi:phosphate acyltransferase [Candidatus Nesciobacter abundans]|uniref:Phosphate acyltransferase n=1 Tax=Candidatus Nesciobacter abundans TaxID=2601668 RepID=A0A5C0UK01_9PROT|nr:hypothetical protein [Candidatus Nesciobacter abundans]QEK39174.1 hypothetical protein FZC36_01885 [Candidatus Nesciobacter abundans]